MAPVTVPEEIIRWLNNLPRGGLAKLARKTQIRAPKLSKLKAQTEHTLEDSQLSALIAERHKDHTNPPVATRSIPRNQTVGTVHQNTSSIRQNNPAVPLHFVYPDDFLIDLSRAIRLRATGTTLRRLGAYETTIEEILTRNKGELQLLFIDPTNEVLCRYEAVQEFGQDDARFVTKFISDLKENAEWWLDVQKKHKNRVTIKKIDYPLAFGLDVIEFDGGGGSIYVRVYPLPEKRPSARKSGEDDRPILEIQEANHLWYRFFTQQFERHWGRAVPW